MGEHDDDDASRTLQFEETTMGETQPAPLPAPVPQALSGAGWLWQGLRAGFVLAPRLPLRAPTPAQLIAVLVVVSLAGAAFARLELDGPALFNYQNWLMSTWESAAMVLVMWCALDAGRKPQRRGGVSPDEHEAAAPEAGAAGHGVHRDISLASALSAWFTLWLAAYLPATGLSYLLAGADARGYLSGVFSTSPVLQWSLFAVIFGWSLAAAARLAIRFAPSRVRAFAVVGATALFYAFSAFQLPHVWEADYSQAAPDTSPKLVLDQETFLAQEALWQHTVDALPPQRPGVADVYGIVFAPYAREDVFLRESHMVADVLARRFDAAGRVVELVNNPATTQALAWATPLNLQRTIEAVARRMDIENDVLVVYLTSHGASDFKLAAYHWPLEVAPLTPLLLRQALDKAGIRNRVVAVSACYSGGWVEPLAGDGTLVMTAADATHTSYGCGTRSPLTFFGRAVFDEQLRQTHSFEQAFDKAVPLIRQREIDGGKPDGFSNPQIRVGTAIRPVLDELAKRLDAPGR